MQGPCWYGRRIGRQKSNVSGGVSHRIDGIPSLRLLKRVRRGSGYQGGEEYDTVYTE